MDRQCPLNVYSGVTQSSMPSWALRHSIKSFHIIPYRYIFRAVPYYGIDREYIGQSVVEVFSIDADGFPISTTSYLDTATLRVLTGIANFNFTLVDL